jgi:predicted metalloprotease with PDZ domain
VPSWVQAWTVPRSESADPAPDAKEIVDQIEARILSELFPPHRPVSRPDLLPTKTTLGLAYVLQGSACVVTRVLVGGPAFLSRKIAEGDHLVAVNGVPLVDVHGALDDSSIVSMLTGDDISGTECRVDIKGAESGVVQPIVLTRMANDILAHKVRRA